MRKKTIALILPTVFLAVSASIEARAANFDFRVPLKSQGLATFQGPTTVAAGAGFVLDWGSNYFYALETTNLVGLANTPNGARLDVTSSGSGKVQIWRNSGGSEVASMSDTGALTPPPTAMKDAASGTVLFFNLASCPSGWSELTSARGRYVVGQPSGGTLAGTQGTALSNLENRAVGQHNHAITDTTHSHTGNTGSGTVAGGGVLGYYAYAAPSTNTGASYSNLTVQNTSCAGCTTAGTNAPYIQLLICQRN